MHIKKLYISDASHYSSSVYRTSSCMVSVTSCRSDNEVIDDSVLVFFTTIALSLFTFKALRMIKLDFAVTRIALLLDFVISI